MNATPAGNLALLDARQQAFWARLTVFRGDWTISAAEQVCSEPRAAAFCETLTTLALITPVAGKSEPRFVLTETLRAYAWKHLEEGDRRTRRDSHRAFFGDLARLAEPFLRRTPDQNWLDRLEEDRDNLLAAAETARGREALEMAVCLWRWCVEKSHHAEGRRMVAYALARCKDVSPDLQTEAYRGLGVLLYRMGDLAQAEKCLRVGLGRAQQAGLHPAIPQILHHLGNIARDGARYDEARELHTRSLDLWRDQKDVWGQATALNSLGILDWTQGHLEKAQRRLHRSAALYAQINDTRQAVKVLANLAAIATDSGHYTLAEQTYRECLKLHHDLGELYFVAANLHNLGDTCCYTGKAAEAIVYLKESLQRWYSLGSLAYIPYSVASLGKAYCLQQDFKRAAVLMGAFDSLRAQVDTVMPVSSLRELEGFITAIRAALPKRSFTRYRNQGHRLSFEQVLAYIASA